MQRKSGCRLTTELKYMNYRAVMLENEKIQIILLLDRGGEPVRWLHKPTDTDLIWLTREGLSPYNAMYADYQMSYLGGWQEMLPEVSATHVYRGALVQRGETAIHPWQMEVAVDEESEVCIRLTHRLRSLPLVVDKWVTLRRNDARVEIRETLRNEAPIPMEANWGHHLAYGAPFLSPASRIVFTPGSVVSHSVSGKTWAWPEAEQDGEPINLSVLPPAGTARDLLTVQTPDGMYRIENPEGGIGLEVRWDKEVWPFVWYWQNYGADRDAPFFACEYNIGLEMFNVRPDLTLAQAAKFDQSIRLKPHGRLDAWLTFEILEEL